MLRKSLIILVALASSGTVARAQYGRYGYGGGASTVQGDYLRGVGVAAYGMGVYNLDTAQANSINTDTAIRLNEYLAGAAKFENYRNALHRAQVLAQTRENYNAIRKRIKENPEERDVQKGDALNAKLDELLDPANSETSFRFSPVTLPADVVRRIPFKLGEKGMTFSMQSILTRGKAKWPVALQDERFARERQAYERAIDRALESALERKIEGTKSLEAIRGVEVAVEDLYRKLDQEIGPRRDPLYLEAKNRLNDLKATAELFKAHKVDRALADIDKYPGKTVNDLRLFMQQHNLRFADARTPAERALFPEIYEALVMQRDRLKYPDKGNDKEK